MTTLPNGFSYHAPHRDRHWFFAVVAFLFSAALHVGLLYWMQDLRLDASELAEQLGVPRAANTVMLAALAYLDATGLPRGKLLEALDASFAKKPKLIPVNRKIFEAATAWCRDHLQEAGR